MIIFDGSVTTCETFKITQSLLIHCSCKNIEQCSFESCQIQQESHQVSIIAKCLTVIWPLSGLCLASEVKCTAVLLKGDTSLLCLQYNLFLFIFQSVSSFLSLLPPPSVFQGMSFLFLPSFLFSLPSFSLSVIFSPEWQW